MLKVPRGPIWDQDAVVLVVLELWKPVPSITVFCGFILFENY